MDQPQYLNKRDEFNQRLKRSKLKQCQFALLLGVSRQAVNRWVNGADIPTWVFAFMNLMESRDYGYLLDKAQKNAYLTHISRHR